MAMIHPSAHVAAGARIADTVEIGPNCTIGDDVTIGPGCHLAAFVNIGGFTTIGGDTRIEAFASLGTPPQSIAAGASTGRLVVGAGCDLGGHVTINVGTRDGGNVTLVGDRCRMLAYSHVAHDCSIGSDVTLGLGVALAGHCHVGDFTQFGHYSAAHQFSHVGASVIVEMRTFVRSDVIPFGLAAGGFSYLRGLNRSGCGSGHSRKTISTSPKRRTAEFFLGSIPLPAGWIWRRADTRDTFSRTRSSASSRPSDAGHSAIPCGRGLPVGSGR